MTSIPAGALPQQVLARITATEIVAPRHFLFSLHAPSIARAARAGQFVHILPRDAQGFDPLLRRAFSIMAADAESGEIQILFRAGGSGTTRLSQKRVAEVLDVLGPLGQPFDISLFHVKQIPICAPICAPILVGGGVGVPPMIFLGKTLKAAGNEPVVLLGARTAAEVLGELQLEQLRIQTRVATDDGSAGQAGRVIDLLEMALQETPRAVVYACGPLPMLRAVAAICARLGVPCQVSMEENMPCGIGVCNGCVVATKAKASGAVANGYERYQRVCVAGPALWADTIDWEAA